SISLPYLLTIKVNTCIITYCSSHWQNRIYPKPYVHPAISITFYCRYPCVVKCKTDNITTDICEHRMTVVQHHNRVWVKSTIQRIYDTDIIYQLYTVVRS